MTTNEVILEKLEDIQAQIAPLIKTSIALRELKDDLIPIGNQATAVLINELQEVESGFQLEDFFLLIKQTMRNTKNFIFILKQVSSIIEFLKDIEPLLKSAVPQLIMYLDDLENRGIFRIIKATLDIRAKMAAAYDPEDIEKIGDGLVALLGLLKRISDPHTLAFLEKLTDLPSYVDLKSAGKIGPIGLASAGFNNEVKDGLGVLIELTKAMGKIKDEGIKNQEQQDGEVYHGTS